jgi:phage shock protein E
MKRLLTVLSLLIVLSACASNKAQVTTIDAKQAYEMMNTQEVIIVDVRTEAEFSLGYIRNAILIPNETLRSAPEQLPNKDAIILVYCRSGNRSKEASEKLVSYGYTNVYDFGGILSWPYEIVR